MLTVRREQAADITERARKVIAHGQRPPETLTLTPPLAEDFAVYGGPDTVARARSWALRNRYLLCDGVASCAHGLYLMDGCPGDCRTAAGLDHVNLWLPSTAAEPRGQRAFLLYHPYQERLEDRALAYAQSHGLQVDVSLPGDDWYGHDTLAVRMKIPDHGDLWPLEREALALLDGTVIFWSEEEENVPEE